MDGILAPGLGDSQRAILGSLKQQRESTLGELEVSLELARETLRDHMKALGALGLVDRSGLRRGGAGRPEVVYRLTALGEELFPRQEGALLGELANFLLERGDKDLLETFFQERLARKRESLRGRVHGLRARDRLQAVAEILREEGFLATVTETQADEPRLCICHCALGQLVAVCDLPCQAEMALLEELLDGHVERESYIPAGDKACIYAVSWRAADPIQEAVAASA